MDGFTPEQTVAPVDKRYKFSGDDVFRMIDAGILSGDARVELIEGDLICMSPQGAPHMLAKQALARLIYPLEPGVDMHVEGTLRLAKRALPSPDIFVHASGKRLDRVRGPDTLLIIEVADSSLAEDLGVKADLYARYGAPEYWVLDVHARQLYVHREPRATGYGWRRIVGGDDAISPERIPELKLRMSDLPAF